jgi:thioredoxin reductase (NADPH)
MYDTIIIGAGPAGISASLYTKRANLTTLVIYYETSNLEKASRIDNYYGFPGGITGCDLFNSGIKQSEDLGVEIIKEQVVGVEFSDSMNFNVKTVSGLYEVKSVIIAVGDKKLRPNIKGVAEFEGKGVSYCAVCDGFFLQRKNSYGYRLRRICVI